MAQARRSRRRKHRGTQAGTVRRRGRSSAHPARDERQLSPRERREQRMNRPPSWRAALNRAAIAAAVFFALLVVVLKQSTGASLSIGILVLAIYTPLFYATDSFLYRLRQRRKQRESGG
jgi:hypothetical protein